MCSGHQGGGKGQGEGQGHTQDRRRPRGGRAEDDLRPSSESVPDPELNDSILDPDMGRRFKMPHDM